MTVQLDPIEELLTKIMNVMGYENSESATHDFAEVLFEAAAKSIKEGNASLNEGLCLNCVAVIADELRRNCVREAERRDS
jgi:hypothetical protein